MGNVVAKTQHGPALRPGDSPQTASFSQRNQERIAQEAQLDGLYVLRTSLPASELGTADAVRVYQRLRRVERAFRSFQTVDLQVPAHPPLPPPIAVRAHVFLCMLAYYIEWHMRRKLAPLLFDADDLQAAPAERASAARRKAAAQRTPEGAPLHSFRTLLDALATIVQTRVQPQLDQAKPFDLLTPPPRRCSSKPSTCSACACSAPSTASPQTDAGSSEPTTY